MAAPLRSIDPRARLAAAALLSVCVAVAQTLAACLAGLGLGLALLLAARPDLRELGHRAFAVNIFLLFLWCVTPWTTPGAAVWKLGPITVTGAGLWLSLLVSLKANAICATFTALTTGMDIATLGHALRRLGCPQGLTWLLLFMGRYIHVIRGEWHSLMTAARLRCFVPKSNAHTWRTLANLLGLLLVRSHDRARRVHEAMLLRCFTGSFRPLDTFAWRGSDTAFLLALVCCCAVIIGTELYGGTHA